MEPSPTQTPRSRPPRSRRMARASALSLLACAAMLPHPARASFLSGDALDSAANVISWFALLIVPVVLVTVFWLVHILPEKIAEKRRHPQLEAIKTLCLLSLFFGGLLFLLSKCDVSFLWPMTALSFVFSTFAAIIFLGERVSTMRWAGVILIVLGAACITWSEKMNERKAEEAKAAVTAAQPPP